MKYLKLFILLFSFSLFGQTYRTITIDGNKDFDEDYERFNTTSGGSNYGYITWDANYIYLGYQGNTPAGSLTDNTRVIHIYIDTDPQIPATNGTGTTIGLPWRWTPTLPFTANYSYKFKTIDNTEYKNVFSSGAWQSASFETSNWKNTSTGYWEIRIKRADIGSPSQIYIISYIEEDWDGGFICLGVPDELFTNTNTQGSITFNQQWYSFTLTSGVYPNQSSPLPVELVNFLAIKNIDKVVLQWQTATEVSNFGWYIERSKVDKLTNKASSWQSIGFVKGAGNSNSPKEYSFVDNSALYGEYAYRLKQIDIDGSTSYSDELRVFVGKKPEVYDVKAFPNPFNPETKIRFELPEAGNVKLSIYDLTGRLITTLVDEYLDEGIYEREFNGSNLSSGIYFTILQSKDVRIVRKMQLIK